MAQREEESSGPDGTREPLSSVNGAFMSSGLQGADTNAMSEKSLECPVCLQTCIHPVMLPCKHIFCYLCIKGVANQSKRCALCRREIPLDFLSNPLLIKKEELLQTCSLEDGKQWYYEGRHGWWQYDERTTSEMEERYKAGDKHCEILIAGFLYVIDFEQMLQYRRNDHTRRRRIKRDAATAPKKGVAGLKIAGETSDTPQAPQDDGQGIAQNSPPQSPQSAEDPVSPNPEDLSTTMANLSLSEARRLEHRHYLDDVMMEESPQRSSYTRSSRLVLETPSSSSDSDWD